MPPIILDSVELKAYTEMIQVKSTELNKTKQNKRRPRRQKSFTDSRVAESRDTKRLIGDLPFK